MDGDYDYDRYDSDDDYAAGVDDAIDDDDEANRYRIKFCQRSSR